MGGYERGLPERVGHDYCSVDTASLLSYRQTTKASFEIVGAVSSNRFWGLVQRSSDDSMGFFFSVEVANRQRSKPQ
jgi:hypothetical protein